MSDLRTVPAFVLVDADTNLAADLVLSSKAGAADTDPRVFILDRHYDTQIGLNLSDLRRMVLAIEQAADRHTAASQEARLMTTPAPVPPGLADYVVMFVPSDQKESSRVVNQWTGREVGRELSHLVEEISTGVYAGLNGRLHVYRVIDGIVQNVGTAPAAEVQA